MFALFSEKAESCTLPLVMFNRLVISKSWICFEGLCNEVEDL